jgi:rRNA processing protein Krr1/Pno1
MKDQPAYIMDIEDIVRMRDLEIRKLKERVAEMEGKIAAAADEMLKAEH